MIDKIVCLTDAKDFTNSMCEHPSKFCSMLNFTLGKVQSQTKRTSVKVQALD